LEILKNGGNAVYTEREMKAAAKIIRRIARESSLSEAQVRSDMQKAIKYGISSPDAAVQAHWATLRYSGAEPTVEEFILWAASIARSRMGN